MHLRCFRNGASIVIVQRKYEVSRPIRLGMVDCGPGAMIGSTHRVAALMDGHYTLVASAFSRDPQKSTETARSLGVAPDRNYAIHTQMAQSECARADGIEAVAIVTPNNSHIPIA